MSNGFGARALRQAIAVAQNYRAALRYLRGQVTLAAADVTQALDAARMPEIAADAAAIGAAAHRVAATH